jgi:hypothetical protein
MLDVGNRLQVLHNQNVPRKWGRSTLDRGLLGPNGRSSQLCMLNTSVGHMAANDASERIVNAKLGTGSVQHVLAFTKMQAKKWMTEFRALENQYFSLSHIIK